MFVFIFKLKRFTIGDGAVPVVVEKILCRGGGIKREQRVQKEDRNSKRSSTHFPQGPHRGCEMAINLVIELGMCGNKRIEPP